MFPGANAQVYYNDDGEPVGWDYPSYDEHYDEDYDRYRYENDEAAWYGDAEECVVQGLHGADADGNGDGTWDCAWCGEDCTEITEAAIAAYDERRR